MHLSHVRATLTSLALLCACLWRVQIYYYASLQGCAAGQKVAVQIVDGYEGNFQQCYGMGKGSSSASSHVVLPVASSHVLLWSELPCRRLTDSSSDSRVTR